jgi:competence protein ComEC
MHQYGVSIWKKAPFIRLLIGLVCGILLQWYIGIGLLTIKIVFLSSLLCISSFFFLPFFKRYQLNFINGIAIHFLFASVGGWLIWQKDIRHHTQWFPQHYNGNESIIVTLQEPLSEKAKSYKANASATALLRNDSLVPVTGTIILYFKKDSIAPPLEYGSQLIFHKTIQPIINSGNPGGFDYKRYCLFQGITHQVFLQTGDYVVSKTKNTKWLQSFIVECRKRVLHIIRTHIQGEKEQGLAEALLIGYKDDLDRSLVQSYTNTGVVHVISISGLHLGLIYWLLLQLLKPLQKNKRWRSLHLFLILLGLWLFTLLAGAQASVLRSAVMFSCIVIGQSLNRKSPIYNTLALSAFLLLCINPFWLWDIGFQLSYTAVLSIVLFMKPVYNWFYFPNKFIDWFWKLNAVTIAAQLLTTPISLYHFHQFPNYFLLTNFMAVPLSTIIVLAEIIVCALSFIPFAAGIAGTITAWLIRCMNKYVEWVESIPHSVSTGIQVSAIQAIALTAFICAIIYWLREKNKTLLIAGLFSLLVFSTNHSIALIDARQQQKIIVYNIPGKAAIDFVEGQDYYFAGDSSLQSDDFTRNFHLQPARTLQRLHPVGELENLFINGSYITFLNRHILLLDETRQYQPAAGKQTIDLLIVSGNPKLYFNRLQQSFTIRQVVVCTSPAWKKKLWKRDCDSLRIPFHDVSMDGAFVMNIKSNF